MRRGSYPGCLTKSINMVNNDTLEFASCFWVHSELFSDLVMENMEEFNVCG